MDMENQPHSIHGMYLVSCLLNIIGTIVVVFAFISTIWLLILGEFKVVILGILVVTLGHHLLNLLFLIPSGIVMLGINNYKNLSVFSSILILIANFISFAIFYIYVFGMIKLALYAYASCNSLLPCVLFSYSVSILGTEPRHQIWKPVQYFFVRIAYTIVFSIMFMDNLSYASWTNASTTMIIIFIIASLIDTYMSINTIKEEH